MFGNHLQFGNSLDAACFLELLHRGLQLLVDASNGNEVYDCINALMHTAEAEGNSPLGDYQISDALKIHTALEDSISNDTYEEGDAFREWVIFSQSEADASDGEAGYWSKNYLDVEPQLPPPRYSPKAVAEAILYAAEHPMRDIYVGGASRMMSAIGKFLPSVADRVVGPQMHRAQRSTEPAEERQDALWHSGDPVEGGDSPRVCSSSLYTDLTTRWKGVACAGLGAAATLVILSHCLPKAQRKR